MQISKFCKCTVLMASLIFATASGKIFNKCVQSGMFSLNWDDGPGQYTKQLLKTLRDRNVKATFHVTTLYLTDPNVQSVIQQIAQDGHLIGLRAEASWNLMSMTDDQITSGVVRQAKVLASFIGYTPKFIRLAYNGFDDRVLRAIESTGLIATSHNLETYDYGNPSDKIIQAFALPLSLVARGGSSFISIQHDGVQQSVAVADRVIDLVQKSGYKFVKLDECLGLGDMTKNRDELVGGNDSIDFGSISGPNDSVPMAGGNFGGPSNGGASGHGGFSPNNGNSNIPGSTVQQNSSNALSSASTAAVTVFLVVLAFIF